MKRKNFDNRQNGQFVQPEDQLLEYDPTDPIQQMFKEKERTADQIVMDHLWRQFDKRQMSVINEASMSKQESTKQEGGENGEREEGSKNMPQFLKTSNYPWLFDKDKLNRERLEALGPRPKTGFDSNIVILGPDEIRRGGKIIKVEPKKQEALIPPVEKASVLPKLQEQAVLKNREKEEPQKEKIEVERQVKKRVSLMEDEEEDEKGVKMQNSTLFSNTLKVGPIPSIWNSKPIVQPEPPKSQLSSSAFSVFPPINPQKTEGLLKSVSKADVNLFKNKPQSNLFDNTFKNEAVSRDSAPKAQSSLFSNGPKTQFGSFSNAPKAESNLFSNGPKAQSGFLSNLPKAQGTIFSNAPKAQSSVFSNAPKAQSSIFSNPPKTELNFSNIALKTEAGQSNAPKTLFDPPLGGTPKMQVSSLQKSKQNSSLSTLNIANVATSNPPNVPLGNPSNKATSNPLVNPPIANNSATTNLLPPQQRKESKNLTMISRLSMSKLQNRELKHHSDPYIDNKVLLRKIRQPDAQISLQELWRIISSFQHYDISQQKQQQFSKISADTRVFGIPTLNDHQNWKSLRRLIQSIIYSLKQQAMCNQIYSLEILNMLVGNNMANYGSDTYPWYRIREIQAFCMSSIGNDYEINTRHPVFLRFLKQIMVIINIQKITMVRIFQSINSNDYVSSLIGQKMRTCSHNIIYSIRLNTNYLFEDYKDGSNIQKQNIVVSLSSAISCLLQISIQYVECVVDIREYVQMIPKILIGVPQLQDKAIEVAIRIMRLDEVVDSLVGDRRNGVTVVDRYKEIIEDFTSSAIPYFKELLPALSKVVGRSHEAGITKVMRLNGAYWLSWFWLWLEGKKNMQSQQLQHTGRLFANISRDSYIDFWTMFGNGKAKNITSLLKNLYVHKKDKILLEILNNLSGNLINKFGLELLKSMKHIFNKNASDVLKEIYLRNEEKSVAWMQIVSLFCRVVCLDIEARQTVEEIMGSTIHSTLLYWLTIESKSVQLTIQLINLFNKLLIKEESEMLNAIEQNEVSIAAIEGCMDNSNEQVYLKLLELLNQHLKVLIIIGTGHKNYHGWMQQLLLFLERQQNIELSFEYVCTILENYRLHNLIVKQILDQVLERCKIDKLLTCIHMCDDEDKEEMLVINRLPRFKHVVEIRQITYGLRTIYMCLATQAKMGVDQVATSSTELKEQKTLDGYSKMVRQVQKCMMQNDSWIKVLMSLAGSPYFDGDLVRQMRVDTVTVLALKSLTMLLYLYVRRRERMPYNLNDEVFWNQIRSNLQNFNQSFRPSMRLLIILSKIKTKIFQTFCRQSKPVLDKLLFSVFRTNNIDDFAGISTLLFLMSKCQSLMAMYRETICNLVSSNLFRLAIQSYLERRDSQIQRYYSVMVLHNILTQIHYQLTSLEFSSNVQDILHNNIMVLFDTELVTKISDELARTQCENATSPELDIHEYYLNADIRNIVDSQAQHHILYHCYRIWHKLCAYTLYCNEVERQTLSRAIMIKEKEVVATMINYIDRVGRNQHDINLTMELLLAAVTRLHSRELIVKCCQMVGSLPKVDSKYGITLIEMCCLLLQQVPESIEPLIRGSLENFDGINFALLPQLLTGQEAVEYAFNYMWSSNGATQPINFIICMKIITTGMISGVVLTERQMSALVKLIIETSKQNMVVYNGQHTQLHQAWLWMLIMGRQLLLRLSSQVVADVKDALIFRINNIKDGLEAPQYSPLKKNYVDSYWLRYEIYLLLCGLLSISTHEIIDFGGSVENILMVISERQIMPMSNTELLQSAEVIRMMGTTNYVDCLEVSVGILWRILRFGSLSGDFATMLVKCLENMCRIMSSIGMSQLQHEELLKRAELWGRGNFGEVDGYVSTTKCTYTVEGLINLSRIVVKEMIEIAKEHIRNLKNMQNAHDFAVSLAYTIRNLNAKYPYALALQDANTILDSLVKYRRV